MVFARLMIVFLFAGLLTTACSGTKTNFSWSDKDFKGEIKSVYIIGIVQNEFNREYLENTIHQKLKSEGISSIPSYIDIPNTHLVGRGVIIEKMVANDCSSVLLTKVTNQRTVASFTLGRTSHRYVPGPVRLSERSYSPWGVYYATGYRFFSELPSSASIIKLTAESALYDLQTEELLWSVQMETDFEGKIEAAIQKFVDEAAKGLKSAGLI